MKADDASGSNITINSVIKLASFLQRALDKGRSNYIEMGEVSKYVNHLIKTNINECLSYIELMLNDKRIKRLRNDLLAVFNELLSNKISYEQLITVNGKVDKERLRLLIDLDDEIIDCLKNLRDMFKDKDAEMIIREEKEIRKLAAEIERNVIKKKGLL